MEFGAHISTGRTCIRTVIAFLLLFAGHAVMAATYYSKVASGNFSLTSSWTADTVFNPNAPSVGNADIYIIRNGHSIILNGNRTVGQVIVRSGGTLSLNGNRTLTTAAPLIINAGVVIDLNIRLLTVAGDWENNGTVTITTGRVTCNTGTGTNNGTITISSTGRLVRTTGTFINNGAVSMVNGSYFTATTGDFNNSGTFTVTGTATITPGTGNIVNTNGSSSIDFGSSNVTVTGTAANQEIGGFVTTGRFTCSKTSGILTLMGNVTAGGFTKSNAGTLHLGTGLTHTSNNTVVMNSGGVVEGGSSTLYVQYVGSPAWSGTGAVFTAGTSTVILNGAGNQSISSSGTPAMTFHNLVFAGSGTKTFNAAAITVDNIFSLEETAISSNAPTYGAAATLRYNTDVSRDAGAEWVTPFAATGGVIIDNTGVISANEAKVFNENVPLTIMPGATLSAGANDFSFSGDFVNNGTWAASGGNITITGTVAQDIGGFTTTGTVYMTKTGGDAIMQGDMNAGNLELNGAGGALRLGASHTHTITGNWTNTAGELRGNSSTLQVDGTVSGTGITFISNNSTIHLRGNIPQSIPAFTYDRLECSGTGLKTLTGNTVVERTLTINTGSTMDAGSYTLELSGNNTPFVADGSFEAGTSTVLYSNANSITIAAVNYYNLDGTGGNRIFSTADTIGIAGVFVPGGGSYTVTNSIVDFNGSGDQNIPEFIFHDLIVSNNGIKYILASITVTCQTINIEDDASVEINADGGGKLDVIE